MTIYAIDSVTPAWEKMLKLIFPLKLKRLLILATIIILSKSPLNNNGSGILNIFTSNKDVHGYSPETANKVTESLLGPLSVIIILPIALLYLLICYITNVFSFIFIETVLTNKPQIKTKFKKNKILGFSTFLFDIVISIIFLGTIFLISAPILTTYLNTGNLEFIRSGIWIFYTIAAIVTFIILLFGLYLITSLTYDFIMPKMYAKKIGVKTAWKQMLPVFRKEWLQLIGYIVIKHILSIVSWTVAIILLIPAFIIIILTATILGGTAYLLGLFTTINTFISIIILTPIVTLMINHPY